MNRSRRQATLFVLCVALSIVTFVSLNGFSASVNTGLLNDAKTLQGADIIVRSNYELTPGVIDMVARLENGGEITSARVWEFYSVVRSQRKNNSLLVRLKVVQSGYPFYGRILLKSEREFDRVLTGGGIIVAQALLDRLKLRIGEQLHVGSTTLTIKDVVLQEPDQPVNFFFLGPRVFVSAEDLDRLDLVKEGSRIWYRCLIRVYDKDKIDAIAAQLRSVAVEDQERVDTFKTARSRVKRFFDNLLFFLSLISIFTLLLAGIGIQSALTAFLKDMEKTIAIMKTVGATSHFFTRHYMIILSILGLLGTLLGLLTGFVLQKALNALFAGILPPNIALIISWKVVFEGLCLGVLVVGLFSFIPLHRLKNIKPIAIFRKERIRPKRGMPVYISLFLIFVFFLLLVLWQVKDVKTGLYFVLGLILMILAASISAGAVLFVLKRLRVKSLVVRQAIKGLFRPRNATKPIIITLTASLSVIFSIYLIEQNLDATFIRSYPPDAPNLFFLDIQPSQLDLFSKTLGIRSTYYPIVRARILAVNGEKIDRQKERQRRGRNLGRTFNLTYRGHLLEDEVIVKGDGLHREDWGNLQVSVMDTVTDMNDWDIGDRITFKIQGVPLEARISSIRSRKQQAIRPFFYFVFPEKTLRDAPQTIFTALKVPADRIPSMQTKIVEQFPNVSVIDVSQTLLIFRDLMEKLSLIVRFFAVFSIVAGILIILSSVLATRFARIQEAVYYKILGARRSFVLKVFAFENLFLGLVSAILAFALSQMASWIIVSMDLDIPYKPFLYESFLLIAGTVLLIIGVGLAPSISILRKKPVSFLREQTQE